MAKFVDNSNIFLNACNAQIEQALEMIGIQAENYAKFKCPADTGRLRNSITHTVSGKGGFEHSYTDDEGNSFNYSVGGTTGGKKTVYVGTNVEYGAPVEFGHGKVKPKPYLKPAVTNHNEEYKAIAIEALKH